ncbi:hypothetical protein EB809_01300 [Marinobacter sp. R17]|uniref:hypothetical protein n=1 Tax=Marinobacter sp. R17 TaxID=2484250 RepID=UPI000F4C13F8|nr:hypothetical protein [Marinobacter sp. R17]ROU02167.1 hypothetical protein EB809_01300 [Marinobacter sp. R17]
MILRESGVRTAALISSVLLLGGCAAMQPDLTDKQRAKLQGSLQSQFGAYQDCMVAQADPYVTVTSAPPSDIAEAAQGACDGAYQAYEKAVVRYFTSVVSGSGQDAARQRAHEHAAEAGLQTRRQIIKRVLDQRPE